VLAWKHRVLAWKYLSLVRQLTGATTKDAAMAANLAKKAKELSDGAYTAITKSAEYFAMANKCAAAAKRDAALADEKTPMGEYFRALVEKCTGWTAPPTTLPPYIEQAAHCAASAKEFAEGAAEDAAEAMHLARVAERYIQQR